MRRLQSLWDWLVKPNPRLTTNEDQRNARLFSSILLIHIALVVFLLAAMDLIVTIVDARTTWGDQDVHVILAGTLLISVSYGLIKASFYRGGVWFYILDTAAVALIAPFVPDPHAQIGLLALAVLPTLFAVMGGLSYRESLGILLSTVAIGALQLRLSTHPFPQVFAGITILIIVSITGCILLAFRRHLGTLEQDRRAQLEQSAAVLRESQQRLHTILQSLPTGILLIDAADCRIIDANPQALQLIGADKEQVVGAVCHRFVCPAEQGCCPVLDVGQTVDSSERVLLNTRGEVVPILKTVVPIQLDGKSCLLESFIDITERKQADLALRRYAAELETRNQELDAFAHTVAHDLKSPVTNLIGFAEVLAEGHAHMPPDQMQTSLRALVRNGYQLYHIIEDLLLLAGVRKQAVQLVPLNLAGLANEALQRLATNLQEKQAQIVMHDALGWPAALGYAPWVEEVWVNYVSNALKYGGQPPRIELGATSIPASPSQTRAMVRFWVRDNGPGLAPEQQDKLFAPFERLEQSRAEGHGLGLSIVRRIVDKLGGQVGVESQVGQGSTFYFTLPAALSEPNSPPSPNLSSLEDGK